MLQNRLCETYNSRLGVGRGLGGEEESEGEEDVKAKVEGAKMPVVSSGVHPQLVVKEIA